MLQARPGGREQWAAVRRRPPHSWVLWWSPAVYRLRAGGRSPRARGAAWGARRLGQQEPGLAAPGSPAAGARPAAALCARASAGPIVPREEGDERAPICRLPR